SPEASRWLVKFVPDEFVTHLPRYKALTSLALKGQRIALFNTRACCPATRIIWGIYDKGAGIDSEYVVEAVASDLKCTHCRAIVPGVGDFQVHSVVGMAATIYS
ncbi:hypothetical protein J8655_13730, partial [Dickeya oryzae]|nr:hypothetical protein [Dickeya oryzae]